MSTGEKERLDALCVVLTQLDRVLCDASTIMVQHKRFAYSPAYSQGHTIILNSALITTEDLDGLVQIYGLNYHEVCHLLYTPSAGSPLFKWASQRGFLTDFNLLEDMRIERLFVARFPGTEPYFTAMVSRWLLADEHPIAHVLTHGRRYLPAHLRAALRDAYNGTHRDDLERIIDAFRVLDIDDVATAKKLITEFHSIRVSDKVFPRAACENTNYSKPLAVKAERQLASAAADHADPDQLPDLPGGNVVASINRAIRDVLTDPDVLREMRIAQRTLRERQIRHAPQARQHHFPDFTVTPAQRTEAHRFEQHLLDLVADNQPGWEHRTDSGRLNVGRAMVPDAPLDTVFDRWQEEQLGHDLELILLVDASSSMAVVPPGAYVGADHTASVCAWVIDHAVKAIDADCTTLTFNYSAAVLYDRDEAPRHDTGYRIVGSGTTRAHPAIHEAVEALRSSRRRNKVLAIITDGEWNDAEAAEAELRLAEREGITTTLVYLSNGTSVPDAHGVLMYREVTRLADLVPWGRAMVATALRPR